MSTSDELLRKSLDVLFASDTKTIDTLFKAIKEGIDGPSSVTKAIKGTVISSRVFVDDTLSVDPGILKTILSVSHSMYCGMLITMLQLDRFTQSGKTATQAISAISTEKDYNKIYISTADRVKIALEASTSTYIVDKKGNAINTYTHKDNSNVSGVNMNNIIEAKILPYGKVIDVDLNFPMTKEDPILDESGNIVGKHTVPINQQLKLSLMVRMIPYYVGRYGMEAILGEKSNLSLYKRYVQWRVGEIRFFKDFLLNFDVLKKSQQAAMRDKSGGYSEYNKHVNKKNIKFVERLNNMFGNTGKAASSNVANAVFVVSEETIKHVKLEQGIDLTKSADVQKFFKLSYSMMLFIVDQTSSMVRLYLNGWDDPVDYSYKDMDIFKSKGDTDFGEILKKVLEGIR